MRTFLTGLMVVALGWASGAWAVTIDTVPIGNTGNTMDVLYVEHGIEIGYGAVDYVYNMGTYEVTTGQYLEFLNAVAATDTYGLYNPDMDSSIYGSQITQNGASGSYTYDLSGRPSGTPADWLNRPANFVSWADAARFANWMHNDQPTGGQDMTTTEDGAYYLNGATSDDDLLAVTREEDWRWAIPTLDEWHKAAYHQNDGDTGNYFDYPTSSDTAPSHSLVDPDPGNNATFNWTIFSPYWRTEVGAHENSDSPYGTFDMGGNLFEWNESIVVEAYRGLRGGAFNGSSADYLQAGRLFQFSPSSGGYSFGFRLSKAPGPAGLAADFNDDGVVDDLDLTILATHWQMAGDHSEGDADGSGFIDDVDLTALATEWPAGAGPDISGADVSAIPEPATLSLLALSGLALLRRRRL